MSEVIHNAGSALSDALSGYMDADIVERGEIAAEIIGALDNLGFVIVPREPTEAMHAAGVNVVRAAWDFPLTVTPEGVQREAYRAMIEISQDNLLQGDVG